MYKKTSLVIMAAGLGSRFGEGIKQLQKIGPGGQLIIDYSIHDALNAGYDKVVFIIRKDIEKDFRDIIGRRTEQICEVEYCFQDLHDLPSGFSFPEGRTKPWGTGQAILSARDVINEPFTVINADDYYGKMGFKRLHDFLTENYNSPTAFAMAGFVLKNTLSDNGSVTRGIVETDDDSYITQVTETKNIIKTAKGAGVEVDGKVIPLNPESLVSMNMWGLQPIMIDYLKEGFVEFLSDEKEDKLKGEFYLPVMVDTLVKRRKATVKVLRTDDVWYGVTYSADKEAVQKAFAEMTEKGIYPVEFNK